MMTRDLNNPRFCEPATWTTCFFDDPRPGQPVTYPLPRPGQPVEKAPAT